MNTQSVASGRDSLDIDSTQTVRALTLPELQAANLPQWFVVQLALSDRLINLDTMPRLDAFASYRLYAVTGLQNGITRYALRLGFFEDEVSASAFCGHMKTFFASASVVRVSTAEQARFAKPSSPAGTSQTATRLARKPSAQFDTQRSCCECRWWIG